MAGQQAGLAVVVGTAATANGVNGSWRSFLRHFDLEHTCRLFRDEVFAEFGAPPPWDRS
ncbi:hypothetical protein ACIF85_34730 [Streptomyces sp. NPDC086033]|uniref:hypothetical protein n=1 Tax=Streptomyces sp. NPDC086033 TaxID=3365747 RepID=UPI0037D48B68